MSTRSILLRLPDPLYERIKQRADEARHSVEDELIGVLATALPVAEELPPDLEGALASLASLDDEDLWDAARNHMSVEAAEQLEQLNFKRQREGLTAAEAEEAKALLQRYERLMLLRARAASMLAQRGHDVSVLTTAA